MYKYNEDSHELEPYLYSTTKNIIYANSKAKAEYTNKPVADKPSWFSRLWNSLFSSDDADQNEKQKKKEEKVEQEVKAQKATDDEPSWFSKMWNSMFSSDEKSDDKEIKKKKLRLYD